MPTEKLEADRQIHRAGEVDVAERREDRAVRAGELGVVDPASRLAARQHGTVSHVQLVAAGVGASVIARRLRSGRLHPLHRGVYLVGHPVPPPLAREAGALLACGGDLANLAFWTAAGIWELGSLPEIVDVLLVGRGQPHRHPAIRVHRTVALEPDEVRHRAGLRITSPARTLVDLGALSSRSTDSPSTRVRPTSSAIVGAIRTSRPPESASSA